MIIFGTQTKELANELLSETCQNCGTQNSTNIHVFQKYGHLFWIPFFPTGKVGISQCNHCRLLLKEKEMPASLRESCNNIKARVKAPIWMFSGLGLVAVLFIIGIITGQRKDEQNTQLIMQPEPEDVIEVKLNSDQYTLYKIARVNDDSVFVRASMYQVNKVTALSQLKQRGDQAYFEEELGLSRTDLKVLLDKGDIIDVERK